MSAKAKRNENVWDGAPISDGIDLRIFLSDAEFRKRVVQSRAWAEYLAQTPIPPLDELGARSAIEKRNVVRAESNLPLLNARQEIARLRQAYESEKFLEQFYNVSFRCITEIYGAIELRDFNSMSAMAAFFAHRQNLIHDLIQKNWIRQTAIGWSQWSECL